MDLLNNIEQMYEGTVCVKSRKMNWKWKVRSWNTIFMSEVIQYPRSWKMQIFAQCSQCTLQKVISLQCKFVQNQHLSILHRHTMVDAASSMGWLLFFGFIYWKVTFFDFQVNSFVPTRAEREFPLLMTAFTSKPRI